MGMHQPIELPDDRGVHGPYKLQSGIRIAATEGLMWDRLHRKMWPNITEHEQTDMRDRMMRTLQDEPRRLMQKDEVQNRLNQLQLSLNRLPPDAHNVLMRGY